MFPLVDCPACEGRGSYCAHANDPAWAELSSDCDPCDYCDGKGKVNRAQAADYAPPDNRPYFPFAYEE